MDDSPVFSLFSEAPEPLTAEVFETLLARPGIRIERILSKGQTTPEGQWYDQTDDEWVVLLKGRARLIIEGKPKPLELGPGDGVFLAAHCRHRVDWTDPDVMSLWLAIHLAPEDQPR